jgi:DNA polymerase-4
LSQVLTLNRTYVPIEEKYRILLFLEAPVILYLRVVPGFWIAAEERARPELRSHPLVVGSLPQQRGLVREANLTAQRCGVRAGMTLSQAHQYCPDGVFLLPDLPRYEGLWDEICSILSTFTPLVQPLEMGHAVCDLSGCERRWNDAWEAACEIALRVMQCGITPWLGVASNWLVAELASTAVGPDGVTIVEEGEERAFLTELPLTSLPGIEPRMALTFQVLGLRTIGQFAALPATAVRQRFGGVGERLHRYARGIDPRTIVPPPDRLAVTAGYECDEGSIEEAVAAIHQLAETCAAELRQRHLAGRHISLTLTWTFHTLNILPSPLRPPGPVLLPRSHSHSVDRRLNGRLQRQGDEDPGFPIPYRIHSMLPQPGSYDPEPLPAPPQSPIHSSRSTAHSLTPCGGYPGIGELQPTAHCLQLTAHGSSLTTHAATRTPFDTAPPIADRAQHLLLQLIAHCSLLTAHNSQLITSITLEITEFQQPSQLSFVELDRIDQTGALRGMDPVRLQALSQQERVLAARYGDASFRHVTHLDPASILTERRFRWNAGLNLS